MEPAEFCSTSRVLIVAGKGGVGKTTVTASVAAIAARAGMSVLIVEVEGKSGLSAAFGRPSLGYDEIERTVAIHIAHGNFVRIRFEPSPITRPGAEGSISRSQRHIYTRGFRPTG